MRISSRRTGRALTRAGLIAGLVAASAAVAVAPASASAELAAACKLRTGMKYDPEAHEVTAFRMLICPGGSESRPVSIQRNSRTVASGSGIVVYKCRGSAEGTFWMGSGEEHDYPCG
jgi:hypothetical protein